MARMIPNYCADDAPPGEKAIFSALASDPVSEHWTVLHSLGIANHVRQVEGEADFVVLVPDHGILVIEVKSHESVAVLPDGRWRLGAHPPTTRGPIKQADEAMHSIRDYLLRKGVGLRGVPMICAAWFTHTRARAEIPVSPEWHDWQIMDSVDFDRGVPGAILRTIAGGTAHLDASLHVFGGRSVGPDLAQAERVAAVLRPKFEFATTFGDRRRAREHELVHFIDEQYLALDAMGDNRAVLFTGPAGTGKTLLAVEAARREAAQGHVGRLLCFNSLLGRRIRNVFDESGAVTVGTFHAQLLEIVGLKQVPSGAGPEFWDTELVDAAIEVALGWDNSSRVDFIVIDEVQDLANEPVLDLLDLLLKGGLASGRMLMFGDFERQSIYGTAHDQQFLKGRIGDLTMYNLKVNCRNLPRIAHATETFNVFPGYRGYRRQDDGVTPTFLRYERGTDQSTQLKGAIQNLRNEGYELGEITVLSPRRADSVALTTKDTWLRQILVAADGGARRPGSVAYSTIHAFKGLEATAIILTDLDQDVSESFDSLIYIGITRATDRLVVFMETNTLRSMLGGNL
jgi:hypothetical protein